MREKLATINGSRSRFEGIFVRFGTKRGYKGYPIPTALFKDIRSLTDNSIVTNHLWMTVGKRLEKLKLKENDIVRFDARVTPYEKGYKGYRDIEEHKPIELDYRLSFPTNVVKIEVKDDIPKLL